MTKKFPNLEVGVGYDGYDDYQRHISYDIADDTEEYDPEEDVPEWGRV